MALVAECGETVDLSLAAQNKVVFIDQVAGTHRLTAVSTTGLSVPLHTSANGKAVLAAVGDSQIARLLRSLRLGALTPNSITSWDRLERELDDIRRTGLAYDRGENSLGISAVAFALKSPSGEVAVISVPAPKHRFL